jgi:hypothetical protein
LVISYNSIKTIKVIAPINIKRKYFSIHLFYLILIVNGP